MTSPISSRDWPRARKLTHVIATKLALTLSECVPCYVFTIHDGSPDTEPIKVEFPDLRAARAEAVRTAGEMLRDIDGAFSGQEWRLEVMDEAGKALLTLRFVAEEHT